MAKPIVIPPLADIVDAIFFAIQREPESERRSTLCEFGQVLVPILSRGNVGDLQFRDVLGQLSERGNVRFVETG